MSDVDEVAGSSAAEMIGRRLGRYTCLQHLGTGGMAVLYLARRTGAKGFTKLFALKRIKPQYAADPNFTRMFMREAKLCASLDHPNIAQVIDFGQDGVEHFLVMEYVHGPDLRRLLRHSPGGRLPLPCAIAVLTRVCAALHYAHEKTDADGTPLGLVHRDVSPTNVLLSVDGAVKLTDFGIAKTFGEVPSGTASGMLVGKPGYMSPEQVRTQPLDRRSDVFCLGILLYEMTTGHRCFFGENVFAILNATQKAAIVRPSARDPEYPAALEQIVLEALQADPEDRYASARDLQIALEELALDRHMRTSDAVLAEYIASVKIDLPDPTALPEPHGRAEPDVLGADGTEFMLSGGASPPASVVATPSRVPRLAVGMAAGLLGALVATVASTQWQDDASAEPRAASEPPTEPTIERAAPTDDAPVVERPSVQNDAAPQEEAPHASPEAMPAAAAAPTRERPRKHKPKPKRGTKTPAAPTDLDAIVPPSRRK